MEEQRGEDTNTLTDEGPLYNEEEMNRIADQYAGVEMDEGILEEDDLLDDLSPDTNNKDINPKRISPPKSMMAKRESHAKVAEKGRTESLEASRPQGQMEKSAIARRDELSTKNRKVPSQQVRRIGTRSPKSKGITA
ncbi:hypothetical protein Bca52824_027133 [Brassica carinata]|uniref:Uncharacterized protein n=1 Tax=Brassica carinata TaxID=52824 RepID=A0A8X7SIX3_BRACI|nr:hypothetical protein Bca52824_027133 [Brassica carinata]